jgi:ubiquinone/menaquinone biosynthesis C-methylase UbiE
MMSIPLSFFDHIADSYDKTWTNTPVGRIQRNAVWRELDRVVKPGDRVLDLGCGTGEDALHFMQACATVDALDGSPGMVEAARRRGVDARLLRLEQIGEFDGSFDLVLSNFGALNCVQDLAALREPLSRLIHPGGTLAICVMNRFCFWETAYYAARGQFKKASRRWEGEREVSSGLRVYYPSARTIKAAFSPEFRLIRDLGIGVAIPPSYVKRIPPQILNLLETCDRWVAGSKIGRAVADHRLLIFTRSR